MKALFDWVQHPGPIYPWNVVAVRSNMKNRAVVYVIENNMPFYEIATRHGKQQYHSKRNYSVNCDKKFFDGELDFVMPSRPFTSIDQAKLWADELLLERGYKTLSLDLRVLL